MAKSFSAEGIVLKRANVGEADRIVTVFTKEFGKMSCVAKGVRKITSSRKSALEPGTYAKFFFSRTQGLPILTQAQLVDAFVNTKKTLDGMRSLSQILEIVDTVMVEEEQLQAFEIILSMLRSLEMGSSHSEVVKRLRELLQELGFQDIRETNFSSITEYIEFLSNRRMKSFAYLTVNPS